MKLPEDKRHLLKEPLGKLFENSRGIFDYLDSIDYKEIITVGDVVSAEFLKKGPKPDTIIVDFTVERANAKKEIKDIINKHPVPQIEVNNPAGQITKELWNVIKDSKPPVKIIVDGEEDLATIPAVLHSPLKSVVIYGQPKEGLVLVRVSEEKKREFKNIIDQFEDELKTQ